MAIAAQVQELSPDRLPIGAPTESTAEADRGTPPVARNGATAECMAGQVQWLPTDRPAIGVAERDRK